MTAPRSLTYREARAEVLARAAVLPAVDSPLAHCLGRALRRSIVAHHPLPPFRNSAMDGFAICAADTALASPTRPLTLPVTQVLAAGHAPHAPLAPGTAARIMTGAMLPDGADAIAAFEDVTRSATGAAEHVTFTRAAASGDHVRAAGGDFAQGDLVLAEGESIGPHALGLLGAFGEAVVRVGRSPRVAVLSTGDELLDIDAPLVLGGIRDSNLGMLSALCKESGAEVTIAERLADDPARLAQRLEEAMADADVTLTIGGVSVGDFDPVQQVIAKHPDIGLWRVAMRPGRPQAFGADAAGRLYFGLPGNPASVACVFEALVRPALRRLQGFSALDRPRAPVRMAEPLESRVGRTDFVRCTLDWRDGALWATSAGAQISGHLGPQARAHALVVVAEAAERLEVGAAAEALVLRLPELA